MTPFDYQAWQDGMDVGANPVENKLRRDWLSKVLVAQIDGYEPQENVEEWEFLGNYADALFLECRSLVDDHPITSNVDGRLTVHSDAGWQVREKAFGNLFNDHTTALAAGFSAWLQGLEGGGESLRQQLLEVYCNQGDAALNSFKIESENKRDIESPMGDPFISRPILKKKAGP